MFPILISVSSYRSHSTLISASRIFPAFFNLPSNIYLIVSPNISPPPCWFSMLGRRRLRHRALGHRFLVGCSLRGLPPLPNSPLCRPARTEHSMPISFDRSLRPCQWAGWNISYTFGAVGPGGRDPPAPAAPPLRALLPSPRCRCCASAPRTTSPPSPGSSCSVPLGDAGHLDSNHGSYNMGFEGMPIVYLKGSRSSTTFFTDSQWLVFLRTSKKGSTNLVNPTHIPDFFFQLSSLISVLFLFLY